MIFPLLALVGPTASGKTDASIAVAEALGAEILSVDSMSVYRRMDAGTAKPSPQQRARVPHHLIDLADPSEAFSVARFQQVAREAMDDVRRRGRQPLLVGGTGLYFRALVDGLEFPGTSARTRGLLQAEATVLGAEALYGRLRSIDPQAADRIEPRNARRTVRALEVAAITGRRFSEFATAWDDYPRERVRAAGLDVPREILSERIDRRTQSILPGLVEETRELMDLGFERFITSTQAIGYAESVAVLQGGMTLEEAAVRTARRTKALARRQFAWFRRDPRIRWFGVGAEGGAGIVGDLISYFRGDEVRGSRPMAKVEA